ncbi:MAG: protein phosphatase 2C domain-containing protein [Acutalibacteraceae bacterium]
MNFFCGGMTSKCTNNMHRNQDTYGTIRLYDTNKTEIVLALVSDGVSMGFEGKYASYNAVLRLIKWADIYFQTHNFDVDSVANEIQMQMQICNTILNRFSEQSGSSWDTCATICGMISDGKDILTFNAGDSRLYEISTKYHFVSCHTKDDIAEDGHSIAQHIGGKDDEDVVITFSRTAFNTDSIYFICTDGMYRNLNFGKWHNFFGSIKNKSEWENLYGQMLNDVRSLGEDDDVTAVILFGSDKV